MLQSLLELAHPILVPAFTAWGAPVTWLEVLAFALSLWMVGCEMRVHVLAWPLAMASSLLYALLFADSSLYGEASLQLFFVAMAGWGWWQWARGHDDSGRALRVRRLGSGPAWGVLLATLAAWPACAWLLHRIVGADAVLPWPAPGVPLYASTLDALATVGSITGTFLLGRKFIENWPTWIAVNGFSVALFAAKALWLTALLYLLFTVLSVAGWQSWRRLKGAAHA
jgi:nicotinamide mononucleotide transporter